MKKLYLYLIMFPLSLFSLSINAQSVFTQEELDSICEVHSNAVDSVFTELYYISDANDATDTDGGYLAPGSFTYRIFAALKPGYILKAVRGTEGSTVTKFGFWSDSVLYNNELAGASIPASIRANDLKKGTVPLDSWLTVGKFNNDYIGVLKEDDDDGSIFDTAYLKNNDNRAGIPLYEADGLLETNAPGIPSMVGDIFAGWLSDENAGPVNFISDNMIVYLADGIKGANEKNHVLLGQFTSTGKMTVEMDLQLDIDSAIRYSLCERKGIASRDCPIQIILIISDSSEIHAERYIQTTEYDNVTFYIKTSAVQVNLSPTFVNINKNTRNVVLNIFPNPAFDKITITIPDGATGKRDMHYTIYDVYGRALQQNFPGQLTGELDISGLEQGIYFISLTAGQHTYVNRFIKLNK